MVFGEIVSQQKGSGELRYFTGRNTQYFASLNHMLFCFVCMHTCVKL